MPKIADEEVVRVHFVIFKRDYILLKQLSTKKMSAAKIARSIIRSYLKHTHESIRRKIDEFEREFTGVTADEHELDLDLTNTLKQEESSTI